MNISALTRNSLALILLFLCGIPLWSQTTSGSSDAASTSASSSSTSNAAPATAKPDCIATVTSSCDINATITDISAPDSPAFAILGVSPTNVSSPTSLSDLASSVISAFDDNGHFQSGAAIDIAPVPLFLAGSFTLGVYAKPTVKSYLIRVLTRSGFSYASVKGTSTPDTSIRMATGARLGLINLVDPRSILQKCVSNIDVPINPASPDSFSPGDLQKIKDGVSKCRQESTAKVWNATSLIIAGAPSWISTDGSTSSLKLNGGGAWLTYAQGIGTSAQIVVTARRETGQNIVSPSTSTSTTSTTTPTYVLQDTTVAGGSVKFGSGQFNGAISGLYVGKRTAGIADSYPELAASLEKEISGGLYIDVNYRYDVGQKSLSGVIADLKWSFNKKPQLTH